MLVFILVVIIAVLALLLYAHNWSARESKKSHLVHAAAMKSHASGDPIDVPHGTTAAASSFFEAHGTSQKKYESTSNPVAYAGYVSLNGEEVVAVAFRHSSGLTVVTHHLPYKFGNDLLELIQKSGFLKDILNQYKANYSAPSKNRLEIPSDRRVQGALALQQWLESETSWNGKYTSDEELLNIEKLVLGDASSGEFRQPKVKHVPREILILEKLEDLHLQHNELTALPPMICNIASLKKLRLGANSLDTLPASIQNLKKLELLTLWSNNLSELPQEIGELVNLRALNISDNERLNSLPETIVRLTNLKEFEWYGSGEKKLTAEQLLWLKDLKARGCQIFLNDDSILES